MENGKGAHAVGLKNGVGFGSTEFHVLRARGDTSARYLFHWLQARRTRTRAIAYMGGSAGQQRVQSDFFINFRVHRLDPAEQSRIAVVLDTVDEAIAKTEAVIAKLRQVRAGLLHDLLTRGLDNNGQLRDPIAHPEQFQPSPLGRIPKEWAVASLRHFLDSVEYGISTSLSSEGSLPVLRMNNLAGGEASLDAVKFATCEVPKALLLRDGDVLFNRTNSYEHVGRTGIWRGQLPVATFASYLVRLNPAAARLTSQFLNLVLNMPESQQRMRRYATPAVQQVNINPTQLQLMHVAAPQLVVEQERIAAVASESARPLATETAELVKLLALKSGLMTDLLTGRVRVPLPTGGTA
jgi:type I restriction enzyme S subunit